MLSVEPAPGSDLSEVLKCGRAGSVLGDQPWVSHGVPAGAMRHWRGCFRHSSEKCTSVFAEKNTHSHGLEETYLASAIFLSGIFILGTIF